MLNDLNNTIDQSGGQPQIPTTSSGAGGGSQIVLSSTPTGGDGMVIGGSGGGAAATTGSTEVIHDEFEKLRLAREQEKIDRQKQRLTRSISTQQPLSQLLDTDLLLEQLEAQSETGSNL